MREKNEEQQDVTFDDNLISHRFPKLDPRQVDAFRFDFSVTRIKLNSISPIQKYRYIRELSLIGHSIKDVSAILSMPQLFRLNLSWNKIKNIIPICSLYQLEDLSLNHNRISAIPFEITQLTKLKVLRINNNYLNDQRDFIRLQQSINLVNLDVENCPISRDPSSLLYCVFVLPHLSILNRGCISIEYRRAAAERYERLITDELTQVNEQLSTQNEDLRSKLLNFENQQKQNSSLNQELLGIKEKIILIDSENKKQKGIIAQKDYEIEKLTKENSDLKSKIAELQEQIDNLKRELQNQIKSIDKTADENRAFSKRFSR